MHVIFNKMFIIMHSDEIARLKNEIYKNIRCLRFSMFSFLRETSVFLFVVQIKSKLDIICKIKNRRKIKNRIDFIHGHFSVFFVVFFLFDIFRVNYLGELC